jgi:uncharacterized protein
MSSSTSVAIVQAIYECFKRGDIDGIIAFVADDVVWQGPVYPNVPYAGVKHGKAGVLEFFSGLSGIEITLFEPKEFLGMDDRVFVPGRWGGIVRATGKVFESTWFMEWVIRDGKVVRFQSNEDSAGTAAAFSP